MSLFSESVRAAVTDRSGDRCEYCHLPTQGQVATFPIDHIIPRSLGGATALGNLALACPHCNAHKWAFSQALDPTTGGLVPLFNPRVDIWSAHFAWSQTAPGFIEGRTATGRATIERLQMNNPEMVTIRRLLASLGLFSEVSG